MDWAGVVIIVNVELDICLGKVVERGEWRIYSGKNYVRSLASGHLPLKLRGCERIIDECAP